MSGLYLSPGLFPEEFLRPTVDFILGCQRDNGEIPWFDGGYTDPEASWRRLTRPING
jgi:hypothetical protein